MENILDIASRNQKKAWEIIEQTDIIYIWRSIHAEINLVGSLQTGLLMTHRDIDFHIYTPTFDLADSFSAIARLAENPAIKNITYTNLMDTEEKCIEWHAWYLDDNQETWQIDMIHILKGSFYDGYFERVAERIKAVLTPPLRETILTLKYETPPSEKIMGIEYCRAAIQGGVRNYAEFSAWRKEHPVQGVVDWMP